MLPLENILSSLLEKRKLTGEVEASRILLKCGHLLEEFLGEGSDVYLLPKTIRNGAIVVESLSSAWSNKLFLEKYQILKNLSESFPEAKIRDIVIRMGREEV